MNRKQQKPKTAKQIKKQAKKTLSEEQYKIFEEAYNELLTLRGQQI